MAQGIRISNKLFNLVQASNAEVLHSIKSTLDFVEVLTSQSNFYEIEVEPEESKGDVDVKAKIDGHTIAFQVKSLYSLKSNVMLEVIKSSNEFTETYLRDYGQFVKAILIPQLYPQRKLKFIPKIIEYRRVSDNVNVSYASLLYPVDLLTSQCYPRIINRVKRSYPQLKDVDTDYRVAVIDVRAEPINEFILWCMTQLWLIWKGARYPKLSGIILMRYKANKAEYRVGTWLIPVVNPYADNPLDPAILLRNTLLPKPTFGSKYLLLLPVRIYIPRPGWMELMQIEPGSKLTYKGIYFGTII